METKICSKCQEKKEVCEFYVNPNNKKYRSFCRLCFNLKVKEYRELNKEKVKTYSKLYKLINKDSIIEKGKIYRKQNKEKIKIRQKESSRKYYIKNCDIIKEKTINFRKKNPEYFKEWKNENPNYNNEYNKKRRREDVIFKIIHNMRCRLNVFLSNNEITKENKTFEIVGCSPEFLKEHIEKQFTEGMSWDLMGKYIHIDHITPLSSAKSEEEVYRLCHYTNLQPLWAKDNLSKGSKII